MKKNQPHPQVSRAFTLIEMIGVLAIIGILASVVSPRVIEAIRDAKVAGTVATIQTAKSATANWYGRYNTFPTDGSRGAIAPGGTNGWQRNYGDAQVLDQERTTFGDLLASEGFMDTVRFTLGYQGTNALPVLDTIPNPTQDPPSAENSANDFPMILCRRITGGTTNNFMSSQTATRTIYARIPGLSVTEAAALKNRIDGPFDNNDFEGGPGGLVRDTINGVTTGSPMIGQGNCKFSLADGEIGQQGSLYDAFVYIGSD
jgi:prepilin-type N-terminal cleavage/methylation domain-containing protein